MKIGGRLRFTFQPVSARAGPNRIGPVSYLAGLVCAVVLVLEVSDVIISSTWGVLVANHQQTKSVSEALTALGIDHFIPKIETLLIVSGRHRRELRPLLGDYILTSISSVWKSMLGIRGVSRILMDCDGNPAQVFPSEIKCLHDMCDENDVLRSTVAPSYGFDYGQRVTPKTGPFAYHVGRYDKKTKRGDIALFSLFGREQKVAFKRGELISA